MTGVAQRSLRDVLDEIRTGPFGSALHANEYVRGGVPVVNPQHYSDGRIRPDAGVSVGADTAARLSAFHLREGDVVVARRGEMGRCSVVLGTQVGWILGTGSLALRPGSSVNPDYLANFLRSPPVVRALTAASVGSTMANLNQQILLSLPIVVPDVRAQLKVVAAIETQFSRLDAAVAALHRAKANVKRARASVFKASVEGRLVPTEAALTRAEGREYEPASVLLERILAERRAAWRTGGARGKYKDPVAHEPTALPHPPEGWCWAAADQLAWASGYGTSVKCAADGEGPPVLRIPNVVRGSIDPLDLKYATDHGGLKPDGALAPRATFCS